MKIDNTTPTIELISGLVEHAEYAAEYERHYPAKAAKERAAMAEHMNELTRRCDVAAKYERLLAALPMIAAGHIDIHDDHVSRWIKQGLSLELKNLFHRGTPDSIADAIIKAAQEAQ